MRFSEEVAKGEGAEAAEQKGLVRISVVVVTYNRATMLGRALDSIVSQGGEDFEVLVIDDGSTDGTEGVVQRYGERVRLIRQEHKGSLAACRTAFQAARGRWMLFVDSDDRLRPGAVEALRAAAEEHPDAALILGRICSVGMDGREVISERLELDANPLVNFRSFIRGRLKAVIAGALIDVELLKPFGREEAVSPHGMDLAVLGSALLHKCVQIDTVTMDVISHGQKRLRYDIDSIHRSGMLLADRLFDPAVISREAMRYRKEFVAFLQLERTRAYYLAGWHSEAWRSYARAVAASPAALLNTRNLRRGMMSFVRDILGRSEGPVRKPRGHWRWGHRRMLWNGSIGFVAECARGGGPVVELRVRPRTYLLCEPEDGRHVLAVNPRGYDKTGIQRAYAVLAGGLLGVDGEQHAEMRRTMPMNFGRDTFNALVPLVVEATGRHIASWEGEARVNVGLTVRNLCTEVGARIVLGCGDHDRLVELAGLLQRLHLEGVRELRARILRPSLARLTRLPSRRRRRVADAQRQLTQWLERQLKENLAAKGSDVLAAMGRAGGDAGMVRDSVLTIFQAMTEPPLAALGWGLELLAKNPEVQERLAAEATGVCGERSPTADDLGALQYAGWVVSEVLRMYPSEWLLMRRATAGDRLPSGLRVRRGEEVMISPLMMGHDPRFFPEPERFDPERFAGAASWPAGAYVPFGAGPRSCMGEHFARRELALMLAMIVSRYKLTAVAGEDAPLVSPNLFTSQQMDNRVVVDVARR